MILTFSLEPTYSVYIEIFHIQKEILQFISILHERHGISRRKNEDKKETSKLAISIHPPYEL